MEEQAMDLAAHNATEMLDNTTKAKQQNVTFPNATELGNSSKYCPSPSLLLVGKGRAAEGGANFQVNQSPSTCTTSNRTNPCFVCTPT